jgi:hypothetical protein
MLDPPMALEIEDRLFPEARRIEIAGMDDDAVLLALELGDDLAVGMDDAGAAHEVMAVLGAGLRHRDDPGRVLVGAGL